MLDNASSQTAVARSVWACDCLLSVRSALPKNDMNRTANGTETNATLANFGEIRNNDMPPPEKKMKKIIKFTICLFQILNSHRLIEQYSVIPAKRIA